MEKIARRPYGNTGIMITEVSFGAMNLRMMDSIVQSERLVHHVLDRGINLIDTARVYNGVNKSGQQVVSEEIVGRVLSSRTDLTEPIHIVTKGHGYTPEAFDQDLEESLRTLSVRQQGDKLFIGDNPITLTYFFHGIMKERWRTMRESDVIEHAKMRQREGKFTFLGFSSHYHDGTEIDAAIDSGAFQVCELPYNAFNRSLTDQIAHAKREGMAVINMKAFNGSAMLPLMKQMRGICDITHRDMLRFCLNNPDISCVDAGARSPEEIDADIFAAAMPALNETDFAALTAQADVVAPELSTVCRECLHCLEKFSCPQGLDFPGILGLYARFTVSEALGRPTEEIVRQYRTLAQKADECVSCGSCLSWCEYHLDVPKMMEAAHRAMG